MILKSRSCVLFLALITCSITAYCQAPATQWIQCFPDAGVQPYGNYAQSILPAIDGGYIFAGTKDPGITNSNYECWVQKLATDGSPLWAKYYGGQGYDGSVEIIDAPAGGYLLLAAVSDTGGQVTGFHTSTAPDHPTDIWLAKLDDTGRLEWSHSYGGAGREIPVRVITTTGGGYLITGWTNSSDGDVTGNHNGTLDGWVIKVNDTGAIQWQRCLGGNGTDVSNGAQETADGGYLICLSTNSDDGDVLLHYGNADSTDAWLVKLNSAGAIEWQKTYGGTGNEGAGMIFAAPNGGYYMLCSATTDNGDVSGAHGMIDAWVLRLDATGNILWQRCYGGSANDNMNMLPTVDGNFLLQGGTSSNDGDVTGNHGNIDGVLLKIDTSGNILWHTDLGGNYNDLIIDAKQLTDSSYIACGYDYNDNACNGTLTSARAGVIKLGKDAVGITDVAFKNQIKVYPTVTNGILHIEYPNTLKPILHLYNIIGRQIPFTQSNEAGGNVLTIADQPAGIYLLQVGGGGASATFRVLYQP